jgi:hypothetical protein
VQNLLERFDKHTQKHSKPNVVRKHDRGASSSSAEASLEELEMDGKQAMESLDEICVYMIDYQAIVDEFLEQEKQARRQQLHTTSLASPAAVGFAPTVEEM